ncbi:FG-GAP and VCBS repeat-containing protein [Streptomyces sp. NPDC051636]|uniref:FG-GAP and VCBS repeat-containing protein n=1 Tax=Streptomyces sp. NPDC051636 TaxID=3365663 RepID=UPI00379F2452
MSHPRSSRRRLAAATGAALVTGALLVPAAGTTAAAGTPSAKHLHDDFNGDGYSDLAVAAPSATVGGKKTAGYVAVVYGSVSGLQTSTKQVFSQNSAGVPGGAETGDRFGGALTTADLDKDGYADLVVGVGGEDTADGTDAGLVEVIWGGPQGLSGGASLAGGKAYDTLGAQGHLAAGDVDGDGAPDVVTVENAHDLRVLNGPFARDGSTVHGGQVVRDQFDSRVLDLATGDLNGDGITDVAATENDGDEWDARRVVHWTGTHGGLTAYTLVYDIDGAGLQGGENLGIGDVNADGYADIVVGRAVEGYDSDLDTPLAKGGRITWIPGTSDGPDGVKAVFVNQDSAGVPGVAEPGDGFGTDVSVADTDGDGYADIVTGLPGEGFDGVAGAGSAVVLRGAANGPTGSGAASFSQNTSGVPGTAETSDRFGGALHLVDANHDGRAEPAVGAPGENSDAGAVWVFKSTGSGITPTGSFTFGSGTLGTVASGARLGSGFSC